MAFELHQLEEGSTAPNDLDLELHEKVLLTLDDSCQELYRIFFEASSSEQIKLIQESYGNQTAGSGTQRASIKRLSSATLKRRIRLQKDAELKRCATCRLRALFVLVPPLAMQCDYESIYDFPQSHIS